MKSRNAQQIGQLFRESCVFFACRPDVMARRMHQIRAGRRRRRREKWLVCVQPIASQVRERERDVCSVYRSIFDLFVYLLRARTIYTNASRSCCSMIHGPPNSSRLGLRDLCGSGQTVCFGGERKATDRVVWSNAMMNMHIYAVRSWPSVGPSSRPIFCQ